MQEFPATDSTEARDRRIFDLWLACWTNKELAEEAGLSEPQLSEIASKFGIGNLAKTELAAAEHAADFTPPIYNIWKQQEKTNGRGCHVRGRARRLYG